MSKKYLFIVNPASGKVKAKWAKIESELRNAGLDFDIWFTEYQLHAIELVEKAVKEGYRRIIGVGGDGTNNEIINGIMIQKEVAPEELFYSLLPLGTGNDWVKTHNIPLKIKDWIAMLLEEKTILHDIGEVNYYTEGIQKKRYFINVAGMAYDGYVGKYIEEKKSKNFNQLFYLFYIFRCLFQYQLQHTRVRIDEEKEIENKFYTINVGVAKYSAGGMQFVPHACPTDGQFALTLAKKMSKWEVIKAIPYFYNGKLEKHPLVDTFFAKKIEVDALETPVFLEVDGEFLGQTPVVFRLCDRRLRCVVG